jgi:hypothetical protein
MPVRPLKSLPLDLAGIFLGKHIPDLIHPTGIRIHTSKSYVVSMEKNDGSDTKYRCNDCNVSLCPTPCFRIYHI